MPRLTFQMCGAAGALLLAAAAAGQEPSQSSAAPDGDAAVVRTAEGTTVRARRLDEPLQVDGRLDERAYALPSIGDFVQHLPRTGAPATERTEAWVFFDDEHLYVAGRCWDSSPPEAWVADEMRRDTTQLRQNDNFAVLLDTFHDRRNGYLFYTNPLGALADYLVTDEGNPNLDWNPVWAVRTGRFEGGWTVEMAIPFKSLRYDPGAGRTWGIQLRRMIRRKNEWTYLTSLPASLATTTAIFRVSEAATLVGLDLPDAGKNIELKPYAISRVTTDRTRNPAIDNDPDGDLGIDAKYGLTSNLTADFTYNTDFAQVEVDEQQVNLTRFNLVFPEKRDFFLEGRGVFDFGRGGSLGGGGDTPSLFYSRRIGLEGNRVVPIDAGGRLTGKVGEYGIGVVNIQTADVDDLAPAANFTVLRVKRDILRRSSIGAMFTNRTATPPDRTSLQPRGSNQAFGLDAAFSLFQNVTAGAYVAQTETPDFASDNDDDRSYQGRFDYAADLYGVRVEHLHVGRNFNPEVGFVRRRDFDRSYLLARYSPRPASMPAVRKFTWEGSLTYLENGAGQLESRLVTGRFNVELENSDQMTVDVRNDYELIVRPFTVSGVSIPTGQYTFSDVIASYSFGQQRRASGLVQLQRGQFYDGTITAFGVGGARVSITNQLSIEPNLSFNLIERAAGDITQHVVRTRADYAFSPRMFASGLVQYSSGDDIVGSNFRFRWEYLPGSELFVVYTDEHNTAAPGGAALRNRAFVVKVNRLLRF
jgi:hypothetical protein